MTGAVGYSKAIILHFSDLWLDFNPAALSLPWILDVAFFPEPEPHRTVVISLNPSLACESWSLSPDCEHFCATR